MTCCIGCDHLCWRLGREGQRGHALGALCAGQEKKGTKELRGSVTKKNFKTQRSEIRNKRATKAIAAKFEWSKSRDE